LEFANAYSGIKYLASPNPKVISSNDLGISNRLKCLISSKHVAKAISGDVALHWPKNWACRCEFSDLFSNRFLLIDDDSVGLLKAKAAARENLIVMDTWRLLPLSAEIPKSYTHPFNVSNPRSVDFAYEHIPEHVRHSFAAQFRSLTPTAQIKKEVDSFSRHFKHSTISVSIRSWPDCPERASGLFSIEDVYRQLDSWPATDFFVSCDSNLVIDQLRDRYGDRILVYPKRTHANDRVSRVGMQDILIDMLLLSKNKFLIASCFSTYPEVAWWFGGASAKVSLIEDFRSIREWAIEHSGDRSTIRPRNAESLFADRGFEDHANQSGDAD